MSIHLNRRHMIGATAGVAAATALSACGSGTPGQSKSEEGGGGSGGKTVVQFWCTPFTTPENAWYKKVVDDFNKQSDSVRVQFTSVPGDAWDQKLKAAQAAGKAPDLTVQSGRLTDAVLTGTVHELDSLMPKEVWDDLVPLANEVVTVGGKHYGYPLLLEPQNMLYWNKTMFEKAGLDPAKPPTTWAELYSACEKLQPTLKPGQFCVATSGDAGTFGWTTWAQQMHTAGHLPISDDWTSGAATDPKYKELGEFFHTLYSKGWMPKQPLGAGNSLAPFGQEKCAMISNGSWGMSELSADFPKIAEVAGVAPWVSKDGDTSKFLATNGNMKWAVDAKSKVAKQAAEFIAWAIGGETANLMPFFVDTKFTKAPARKSVTEELAKQPGIQDAPWAKLVTETVVPAAILEPTYPWDISLAMGTALEKCMRGQGNPDAAFKAANDEINKVIKRENLAQKYKDLHA